MAIKMSTCQTSVDPIALVFRVNVTSYHLAVGLNQYEGVLPVLGARRPREGPQCGTTCPHTQPLKESSSSQSRLLSSIATHHWISFFSFFAATGHMRTLKLLNGLKLRPCSRSSESSSLYGQEALITGLKAHA